MVFTNALIIDGSGAEPRCGSLAVDGGLISAVSYGAGAPPDGAREVFDCGGLALSPGFIDAHSHSDAYALLRPDAPSKTAQGVTTEIVGQCGASASPLSGGARLPSDWAAHRYPQRWHDIATYMDALRAAAPKTSIVPMTGHRNLRMAVMGMEARPAAPRETALMCELLESELSGGSRGFTTGLLYQPSRNAAEEEIIALCRVCARCGGVYATHLRSESAGIIEALGEALHAARESGVQLQISHFKINGAANWGKLEEAVAMIESARAEGIRVFADRYPYLAGGTDLDVILPDWAQQGGAVETLPRLRDPAARKRILDEMEACGADYSAVMVGGTAHPDNLPLRGRGIPEIAAGWGCAPAEAVLRIIEKDGCRTGAFFGGMSEENLERIYSLPWVMVGSDASIRAASGPLSGDYPHPRAWGAFPHFLAMCRERNLMPLGEAVRRITSLPASVFGLPDRGLLAPGLRADLVVFDPLRCRGAATYAAPDSPPEGVRAVFAGGAPVHAPAV